MELLDDRLRHPGTNDLARAAAFYDPLLAEMGAKRLWEMPSGIGWGVSMDRPAIGVMKPHDGRTATVGNGSMVALVLQTPEQVDRVHAKAMALGALDEGAVGPRGGSFYAGYFRDPDGNKLNIFCITPKA